ncbi:MAG: TetR/AcrR family transcriptional regulator [Candidatus Marinimicrobia bacterium]|nr:TetR/AcrR family transcriptional regulator [Candidatus Neomarinimicrobiota bacterium]
MARPKDSTREKTAENRQKILDSAMDTFAEKGYEGASMRHIAKVAGINHFMLYYHFKDKQTLFEQVIKSVTGQVFSQLGKALGDAEDLESAIGEVYDIYADLTASRKGHLRSFLAREIAAGARHIAPVLRVMGPEIIKLWEPKLCAHLNRKELPYQDVVRSVAIMMSSIVATFLLEPAFQNVLDVYGLAVRTPEYKAQFTATIIGGIEQYYAGISRELEEN